MNPLKEMRMKKRYDFRIPPPPVSSEDIARHKDFDALLLTHQSGTRRQGIVSMRHVMYAGTALAAAAVALLLILRTPSGTGNSAQDLASLEKSLLLSPPLPELKPQFAGLQVETSQENMLGSNPRIVIPPSAFVSENGDPVDGQVEVFFRKLDDFVDFFLAGIRLTHDSASVKRQLESAGMVEIYAEQDGKRVFLAPGKMIQVEFESIVQFTSSSLSTGYFEYFLDVDAGKWISRGRSRTEILGHAEPEPGDPMYRQKMELYQIISAIDKKTEQESLAWEAANPAPTPPAKPQRSNPDQPTIELDFLAGAVPETATGEEAQLYQGAIWQISPNSPAYDPRAFAVTWQSARLKQIEGNDFELILSHGATTLRLFVNPVLTGSAYEKAMEAWKAAFADYENALKQWQQRYDSSMAAISQKCDKEKASATKNWERQWVEMGEGPSRLRVKLRHRMEMDRLGLWTVALPLPAPATVAAGRITDQHDNAYDRRIAYIVNPEQNTLHQVIISGNNRIPLAPGSTLWAVNPDGKIAVLRPRELQQAFSKVTSSKLVLELQEQQPASKQELRKILQL